MAAGPRMELVGKRFVCVGDNGCELDVLRIHEWEWRAGVIRAVSYREPSNSELSVSRGVSGACGPRLCSRPGVSLSPACLLTVLCGLVSVFLLLTHC